MDAVECSCFYTSYLNVKSLILKMSFLVKSRGNF